MRTSFAVGRSFGIQLRVDTSWLFVAALVLWSLSSLFARWHPGWSSALVAATAAAATFVFFASVIVHELAHSLVARFVYGIPVRDITLHMFGGVSSIEREPETPSAELFIAIVGPVASVLLGVAMLFAGAVVTGLFGLRVGTPPTSAIAAMGPLGTLLLWVGPVNVMLGVFNLIPGFPLDGGRVLRALVWKATGSLPKATRVSSVTGEAVGWAFVAIGGLMAFGWDVPFFGTGVVGGLWLGSIGLFLRRAAIAHRASAAIADALAGVRAGDLMRSDGAWVPAGAPLSALAEHWFAARRDDAFPVFAGTRFVGLVSRADLARVPAALWDTTNAGAAMTPRDRLVTVAPDDEAITALRRLGDADVRELPVMVGDVLVGVLSEKDVGRWIDRTSSERPPRGVAPRPRHA